MKNKLLLTLSLVAAGCRAEDIKIEDVSFERAMYEFGLPCHQTAFFAIVTFLVESDDVPLETIEELLTRWFNERPDLIGAVLSYDDFLCSPYLMGEFTEQMKKVSFADMFVFTGRMYELFENQDLTEREKDSYRLGKERIFKIVKVLKQLGVAQFLTDEQVNIMTARTIKKLIDAGLI